MFFIQIKMDHNIKNVFYAKTKQKKNKKNGSQQIKNVFYANKNWSQQIKNKMQNASLREG